MAIERTASAPIGCARCSLRDVCLPRTIGGHSLEVFDRLASARRSLRPGEPLFHAGDAFDTLFAVHSGCFKATVVDSDGREQVTGFYMGGELLGLDGIAAGRYHATAVALEPGEVCPLPYSLLEALTPRMPAVHRHLQAALSRELVREQSVMLLLGSMRAEARIAAFLAGMAQRFERRGYSASDFGLCMTREEIGSYLGLTLETVSRTLARFHRMRIVELRSRGVRVLDRDRLDAVSRS